MTDRIADPWAITTPYSTGFYTSGQFFLEEHYTLVLIGKRESAAPQALLVAS